MTLDSFFSEADAERVIRTLRNLASHDISDWVLTGGLAIELHNLRYGRRPQVRPLHDIDFIAKSFASIPEALGLKFVLSHVHPIDPPGKNMFQAVDPRTGVRIDVFRSYGSELERVVPVTIAGHRFNMVSLRDLVARHARLNWDLIEGKPVAPKYARDFLRILENVETNEIDPVWREHRKAHHPLEFAETAERLRQAIASRSDLLIPSMYSTDVNRICKRCQRIERFPLADRHRLLSILGYC